MCWRIKLKLRNSKRRRLYISPRMWWPPEVNFLKLSFDMPGLSVCVWNRRKHRQEFETLKRGTASALKTLADSPNTRDQTAKYCLRVLSFTEPWHFSGPSRQLACTENKGPLMVVGSLVTRLSKNFVSSFKLKFGRLWMMAFVAYFKILFRWT